MIGAIIVTYNPSNRLLESLDSLSHQVDRIIVIDNASTEATVGIFKALERFSNVFLVENKENFGLSKALNMGIELLKPDFEWIFTFDQDTLVEKDYVHKMIQVFKQAESVFFRIGQVSPRYREEQTRSIIKFGSGNSEFEKILVSLTSGSLFKVRNFDITGLFAEDFFIDYIDYEYCLRLNKMGFFVIEAGQIYVNHEIGNSITHSLLGKQYISSHYSAKRRYFRNRNRIITYRMHGRHFINWMIKDLFGLFDELSSIILFEENKYQKISSVFRGLVDGFRFPVA